MGGTNETSGGFCGAAWITFIATARGETWPYANWPMYGKDLSHTFSNPLSQVNPWQRRVIDAGMDVPYR